LKYQKIDATSNHEKLIASLLYKQKINACYFIVIKEFTTDDNTVIHTGASLIFSDINLNLYDNTNNADNADVDIPLYIMYREEKKEDNYDEGLVNISLSDIIYYLQNGILVALYSSTNKKDLEIYKYLKEN
jgi:hypothetical protein